MLRWPPTAIWGWAMQTDQSAKADERRAYQAYVRALCQPRHNHERIRKLHERWMRATADAILCPQGLTDAKRPV